MREIANHINATLLRVGDRVFLKSFDDLADEFGIDIVGAVKIPNGWEISRSHRDFYGRLVEIISFHECGTPPTRDTRVFRCRDVETGRENPYVFTTLEIDFDNSNSDDCLNENITSLFINGGDTDDS